MSIDRPNAQFVPKYAFDDENELPQAYIRCHESKMIHPYKFLPHERDESRTWESFPPQGIYLPSRYFYRELANIITQDLQGFQGAVLGLLFQGGYPYVIYPFHVNPNFPTYCQ